jgi:hypothetical protein
VTFVVASLVAVVVGNMELAAGQLHLEQVNQQLVAVESSTAAAVEHLTYLESPQSVAAAATAHNRVPPTEVLQIPSVPLEHRLAPPHFSYAPCCSLTTGQ